MANSIKQFGFKVPIILDKDNVIIAGHTRYEAAKSLGIESIPCIIANDLTPEQAKAFRIADNKVAEQSDWNFFKLSSELAELPDFDMLDFGFSDIELDNLSGLASDFYITEPDDYEEEEQAPQFYKPNLSPQVPKTPSERNVLWICIFAPCIPAPAATHCSASMGKPGC